MSGTSLSVGLRALTGVLTAVGVVELEVGFGPAYDPGSFFLAVGWDRTDQASIAVQPVDFGVGGRRQHETFDVSCLLSLAVGVTDLFAALDRVAAAYDALATAIASNQQLGGAVIRAYMGAYDTTPGESETGETVDLRFTVHLDCVK